MKVLNVKGYLFVLTLLMMGLIFCNNCIAFQPLAGDIETFNPSFQYFDEDADDVIKIGLLWPFSGPAAANGAIYWLQIGWAVHDINTQGGVMVDGKQKKIVLIKGDTQMEPAAAKRAAEKLCLQDNVDIIMGSTGSHIAAIGQNVAAKYKKIFVNMASYSDTLMDQDKFNKYTFRTCSTTSMLANGLAHFYANRPEKDFYILCQDYAYGHEFAENFVQALAQVRPDARIVGKDFHPLFVKDFAPYLSKIQGANAQVIITADYTPDSNNLTKQWDQLGMTIPLAGPFVLNPLALQSIGEPYGKGFVTVQSCLLDLDKPGNKEFALAWNTQWKRWKDPLYSTNLFQWTGSTLAQATIGTYWLMHVIEKAGELNPDKIVATWEGDQTIIFGNLYSMRACDHQAMFNMHVSEIEWPNDYYEKSAGPIKVTAIPAEKIVPPPPKGLKNCQ
ncbi:MAG: ABC transporter substrate-binding protein [Desulfatibacillum sp.]|nr:ABC transporter substrate-binding protein [Desulfatibacillum sp.]